jgi:nitroreductase
MKTLRRRSERMDFRDLMKVRRAIREFEDKEVPQLLIEEIIADSCEAPSAGNKQPWSFIIITNKQMIKRLSDESKRNILKEIETNPSTTLSNYKPILQDPGFNVFYNSPCIVYITGSREIRTIAVDCTLAASYFMLSATDRGLGTCWVDLGSVIRNEALLTEIGLPGNQVIVATLILGYPVRIPDKTPRDKPKILRLIN